MIEIFGEKLLMDHETIEFDDRLPSPDRLKYRVLVKVFLIVIISFILLFSSSPFYNFYSNPDANIYISFILTLALTITVSFSLAVILALTFNLMYLSPQLFMHATARLQASFFCLFPST